ncbi:Uma2 family endonuclease [Streptomyces sp. YIM B13518]|uniref:Uma2 family endonuclease n=1 Tax=Streptomyces sp. YIM B13518 TaxID=3366316 RepID=UPI00369BC1B4
MPVTSGDPRHDERPLTMWVRHLEERCPEYRWEIVNGGIVASPQRDGPHARTLTRIMRRFIAAGLDDGETGVLQGVGLSLPTGAEDFAVPDLAVVNADIDEHRAGRSKSYDPACFRLVLEVTAENRGADLGAKVAAYAGAKVPVYVIVDREHQRLHVLTDPVGNEYASHRFHSPGQQVTLPGSIGSKVTLDVAEILRAGRWRTSG